MAKQIIIRPIISEKAESLSDTTNQYTFVVNRAANKIEIAKEVARFYEVEVERVNTINVLGKSVSRNTRGGVMKGRKTSYKKAIVTIKEGDFIDLYGSAVEE